MKLEILELKLKIRKLKREYLSLLENSTIAYMLNQIINFILLVLIIVMLIYVVKFIKMKKLKNLYERKLKNEREDKDSD